MPLQHTAVTVPRPREPADGGLAATCQRRPAWRLIAADGRAHPSGAVRRHNFLIEPGRDPFVRFYFPVLAAFRLGAQRARRAAMADEPADTWERRFGRLVKAAREAAGLTQSRLERDAGLTPTTVTRVERGEYDLPTSELADVAHVLRIDPGSLFPPAGEPERPTPCPHDECIGVLVRLPDGVVQCSEGHTSGTRGHISYDG